MMKHFILLTLLLSLFTSCNKGREIKIVAINAATQEPYAGLEYVIVSSRTAANGEKYRTEATGTLNSNGEALEHIKQRSGRTYSIRVTEPVNTCYNKEITQFFDSPYDVGGKFTFEFAECAYLSLSVNNVNCQGGGDKIKFDLQPAYIPNYTGIIPTEKLGCYSNTFVESSVPSGNWIVNWAVTRNGITSNHDSTFHLASNEHLNFIINY